MKLHGSGAPCCPRLVHYLPRPAPSTAPPPRTPRAAPPLSRRGWPPVAAEAPAPPPARSPPPPRGGGVHGGTGRHARGARCAGPCQPPAWNMGGGTHGSLVYRDSHVMLITSTHRHPPCPACCRTCPPPCLTSEARCPATMHSCRESHTATAFPAARARGAMTAGRSTHPSRLRATTQGVHLSPSYTRSPIPTIHSPLTVRTPAASTAPVGPPPAPPPSPPPQPPPPPAATPAHARPPACTAPTPPVPE